MRQRGFTLVEMLLVVVVMGIMIAIAAPRFSSAATKQSLRGSRNTLIGLFDQTRLTAMQRGRSAELRFEGNRAFVTAAPNSAGNGAYDTIGPVHDLGQQFKVTLTHPSQNPVVVNSKGLAQVAGNITIKTTIDSYTDSVVISSYGRVSK